MIFNSFEFLILFVLIVGAIYTIVPRFRKWLLLLGSAVFIGFNHWGYLALAVATSLMTFLAGIWIDGKQEENPRQWVFRISLVGHLFLLVFFKYFGFLELNVGMLVNAFGGSWSSEVTQIFLPLGISFYIFQSISYLIEVYWEEMEAERDLGSFMLYMLFFMKFLSGPIERPQDFLPQVKANRAFDYDAVTYGLKLMAVGLFKKLVIADRLAPALNDVFASVHDFSGAQLCIATLVYPLQLYADFSGYTDMALGGAAVLGYRLSPNFNRPFIAENITDFWRRWHMSLSFWVRDYIYEPLAAEKRNWGLWGIVYALMVTFILLGLWHGSSWNFVIYGAIQGMVITYEMLCGKWRSRWGQKLPTRLFKFYGIIRTYLIFSISLLFFRIEKLSDVGYVLGNLFGGIRTSLKELNLGMRDHEIIVFAVAVVLMFLYEYAMNREDLWKRLDRKPLALRWAAYYLLIIMIFVYGEFGTKDFIYLQF